MRFAIVWLLPVPGGTLDDHRAGFLQPADDLLLLPVRVLREQDVRRVRILRPLGRSARVDADDAIQRLRELGQVRDRVEIARDVVPQTVIPVAEVQLWLPVEIRATRALDLELVLEVLTVRPKALDEVLQELARRLAPKRVEVLPARVSLSARMAFPAMSTCRRSGV